MQFAPIPENEAERIKAVRRYDILDTGTESEFDDFTHIASQICGTTMATISLIDTAREWFKSKVGIEGEELPRELTFCGHALTTNEIFEVPDALEDERFRDNPFVLGDPKVRFYAGAPLISPEGMNLGTICVFDRAPRMLTPAQRSLLTVLSRQVVNLLELRLASRRIHWMNENLEFLVAKRTRELRESERFAMASLDALSSQIVVLDEKGFVLRTNRAWREFATQSGASAKGVGEGADYLGICERAAREGSEEAALSASIIRDMIAGQRAESSFEYPCHFGSEQRWFFCRFTRFPGDGPVRVVVAHENITPLKLASMALEESNERFRQLAEQSSEGFWFVGVNPERNLFVSPACEKIWGLPAEKFYRNARTWLDAIHPEDQGRVRVAFEAVLTGREPRFETEYRVIRPDGTICWVSASGTPIRDARGEIIRVGGVARDITERRQIEGQRLRTQRLESIGTLASGIAHDLNNSLTPILMVTALLRAQYPKSTEMIDNVETSARHGADMVRQLLTFARGVEGERLLVQTQHLFKEMEKIVRGTFPKNIQLRTHYPKTFGVVLGDVTQLHQVLLNLCVNARDAMPEGGTLTLEAENVTVEEGGLPAISDSRPGRYIVWRISDTGMGIRPEMVERIFEPFFSTKGPERGTGLGLSTVSGIVKSHGGFIQVNSTLGQGSTFSIYLPVESSAAAAPAAGGKAPPKFRGKGEVVLVVDDEATVRQAARAVLISLNFQVLTAANGLEALVLVGEKRAELRAVITDLHMPGLDGVAFVRMLRTTVPEARIVVASGRLEDAAVGELKALEVTAFLDKPFTQEKLEQGLKLVFPD
jgi:PAS domain S-box-containing protein